jgi:hypothetical protein
MNNNCLFLFIIIISMRIYAYRQKKKNKVSINQYLVRFNARAYIIINSSAKSKVSFETE